MLQIMQRRLRTLVNVALIELNQPKEILLKVATQELLITVDGHLPTMVARINALPTLLMATCSASFKSWGGLSSVTESDIFNQW